MAKRDYTFAISIIGLAVAISYTIKGLLGVAAATEMRAGAAELLADLGTTPRVSEEAPASETARALVRCLESSSQRILSEATSKSELIRQLSIHQAAACGTFAVLFGLLLVNRRIRDPR